MGKPRIFWPRWPEIALGTARSVYDPAPLRALLERLVDFDRLNSGELRLTIVATDVESGEAMVFDNRAGCRIRTDHLIASCGLMPEFPAVEIEGRLAGDGAFVANAPIGFALEGDDLEHDLTCILVDAFSSGGRRPATIEQAAGRSEELLFGNQTRKALKSLAREHGLRKSIRALESRLAAARGAADDGAPPARAPANGNATVRIVHLSHRPAPDESGHGRPFDFSRHALFERWDAGYRDMQEGLRLYGAGGAATSNGVSLSIWR